MSETRGDFSLADIFGILLGFYRFAEHCREQG